MSVCFDKDDKVEIHANKTQIYDHAFKVTFASSVWKHALCAYLSNTAILAKLSFHFTLCRPAQKMHTETKNGLDRIRQSTPIS